MKTTWIDRAAQVELQLWKSKHQPEHAMNENQKAALENLFGITRQELHRWPGAMAYCGFLESLFEPLLADEYGCLWKAINKQRPGHSSGCWPWFSAVCSVVRSHRSEDSSIEEVWNGLKATIHPSGTSDPFRPAPIEKTMCLIAVFSVLCWATMMLQPKLHRADFEGSPTLMASISHNQSSGQALKMDIVRRPIPAVFRTLKRLLFLSRWQQPTDNGYSDKSVTLYLSTLHYETLQTIGKIHIEWVDDLSSHLDFDSANRSLSVFRFPTFCALTTLRDSGNPIFEG